MGNKRKRVKRGRKMSSSSDEEFDDIEYTQPLEGGNGLKKRVNSCWTMFVDTTVSTPNLESTLKCLSQFYAREILQHMQLTIEPKVNDVFLDRLLPLEGYRDDGRTPQTDDIYNFLFPLFKAAGLTAENAIIMMVYVDRMSDSTKVKITVHNWKRMLLGALLMASKVWDDQAIFNADFCSLLQNIDVDEMNSLERFYLSALSFNVSVKSSKFATKYFDLREFARRNNTVFDLQALSETDAKELEMQTAILNRTIRDRFGNGEGRLNGKNHNLRKVKSDQMFVSKSPAAGVM